MQITFDQILKLSKKNLSVYSALQIADTLDMTHEETLCFIIVHLAKENEMLMAKVCEYMKESRFNRVLSLAIEDLVKHATKSDDSESN